MSLVGGFPPGEIGLRLYLREKEKEVGFDAVGHTYHYNGRTLISSTTLIKKFFPKFDAEGISENLAKKELGEDADFNLILQKAKEIRQSWYAKAGLGTIFHSIAEYHLLSKAQELLDTSYVKEMSDWKQQFDELLPPYLSALAKFLAERRDVVDSLFYTELLVWSKKYSVSGQVDFLTWNDDGSVDIWDWKTSNTIAPEGVSFGKRGFGSLANLPDTNFYHYALQLSLYQALLEDWGIRVNGRHLVHIKDGEYKIIDTPYLGDEIYYILNSTQ